MKRLLVVGNGSLGLWWSFQLSRLANESLYKTFLLTRTEESAQVINKKGIVVEDKTSASTYCISCPSFSNVKQFYEKLQGHADILLLCVKQYHLKSALVRRRLVAAYFVVRLTLLGRKTALIYYLQKEWLYLFAMALETLKQLPL